MQLHNPTFQQFHDHALLKLILEDYIPLMKLERDKVPYSSLTKLQKYQYNVCTTFGKNLSQFDRIDQAKILLNSYPQITAWRKHYGQAQYFQYHTEMYLASVTGLVDRLMLLVNDVYAFGVQDDLVRVGGMMKKLHANGDSDIHELIIKIREKNSQTKQLRDRAMHIDKYRHKELDHLALLEHFIKEGNGTDADFMYLKGDVNFYSYFFKRSITDEIKKIEGELIPLIDDLFIELLERYKIMCKLIAEQN